MKNKKIDILLVEDNAADALIIQKIFEGADTHCNISHAEDGEYAMNLLCDSASSNPDIILLDINMPKKDGKTVLREIKANELLRHIPVIMMTGSNSADDILDCYSLCASSYVLKPANVSDHKRLLAAFDAFWFDFAVLPETRT